MTRLFVACLVLAALLGASGCDDGEAGQGSLPAGAGRFAVVHVPGDADTIAAGLEKVAENGMVLVGPGTYPEQVLVTTPGVTLRGVDRNTVVVTGEGKRTAGIVAIADGVRIENLTVTDTLLYGVLVTGTHDGEEVLTPAEQGYDEADPSAFPPLQRFRVDHVTATNNGLYGIYAFNAQHGVISRSWTSGSADSGIYVGQCRDCDTVVSGNVATRNAVGFENANASDSLTVVGNRFSSNRVGLTLTSNYQEAFVPQRGNLVAGNVISDNNEANSPAQADGGFGIGVGIAGGQENRLLRNLITGNRRAGVMLDNAEDISSVANKLDGNVLQGNGLDVVNVALDTAPTRSTCLVGPGLDRLLLQPARLGIDCRKGVDAAVTSDRLPSLSIPEGVAFLEVARPAALPTMTDPEKLPEALPARVSHPAAGDIPRPASGLLAAIGR